MSTRFCHEEPGHFDQDDFDATTDGWVHARGLALNQVPHFAETGKPARPAGENTWEPYPEPYPQEPVVWEAEPVDPSAQG